MRESFRGASTGYGGLNMPEEYEMDTDDLDAIALSQLESSAQDRAGRTGGRRSRREQTMPLLVGLMDSSAVRRSVDSPGANYVFDQNVDLEELAAKQTSGGGMLDSVANMANSILGAGSGHYHFIMKYS